MATNKYWIKWDITTTQSIETLTWNTVTKIPPLSDAGAIIDTGTSQYLKGIWYDVQDTGFDAGPSDPNYYEIYGYVTAIPSVWAQDSICPSLYVNAGNDASYGHTQIQLSGSAYAYSSVEWSVISEPSLGAISFVDSSNILNPRINLNVAGNYTLQLTAKNLCGIVEFDQVTIIRDPIVGDLWIIGGAAGKSVSLFNMDSGSLIWSVSNPYNKSISVGAVFQNLFYMACGDGSIFTVNENENFNLLINQSSALTGAFAMAFDSKNNLWVIGKIGDSNYTISKINKDTGEIINTYEFGDLTVNLAPLNPYPFGQGGQFGHPYYSVNDGWNFESQMFINQNDEVYIQIRQGGPTFFGNIFIQTFDADDRWIHFNLNSAAGLQFSRTGSLSTVHRVIPPQGSAPFPTPPYWFSEEFNGTQSPAYGYYLQGIGGVAVWSYPCMNPDLGTITQVSNVQQAGNSNVPVINTQDGSVITLGNYINVGNLINNNEVGVDVNSVTWVKNGNSIGQGPLYTIPFAGSPINIVSNTCIGASTFCYARPDKFYLIGATDTISSGGDNMLQLDPTSQSISSSFPTGMLNPSVGYTDYMRRYFTGGQIFPPTPLPPPVNPPSPISVGTGQINDFTLISGAGPSGSVAVLQNSNQLYFIDLASEDVYYQITASGTKLAYSPQSKKVYVRNKNVNMSSIDITYFPTMSLTNISSVLTTSSSLNDGIEYNSTFNHIIFPQAQFGNNVFTVLNSAFDGIVKIISGSSGSSILGKGYNSNSDFLYSSPQSSDQGFFYPISDSGNSVYDYPLTSTQNGKLTYNPSLSEVYHVDPAFMPNGKLEVIDANTLNVKKTIGTDGCVCAVYGNGFIWLINYKNKSIEKRNYLDLSLADNIPNDAITVDSVLFYSNDLQHIYVGTSAGTYIYNASNSQFVKQIT